MAADVSASSVDGAFWSGMTVWVAVHATFGESLTAIDETCYSIG